MNAVMFFVIVVLLGIGGTAALRTPALRATPKRVFAIAPAAALHSHLRHEPQFRQGINEIKRILAGRLKLATGGVSLKQQVLEIIDSPVDIFIVLALWIGTKPLLRGMYEVQEFLRRKFTSSVETQEIHTFRYSLFGYLQEPFKLLSYYMPFLYVVDIVAIGLHSLGLDSHLKGDVPRLASTLATSIIGGKFLTAVKDWALHNARILSGREHQRRDAVRESTVDELTSLAIWALVATVCVEACKVEMGFALGSVFAVGGTVTASIVLALRSTFENVVGGLLLKLNDKFRVGEIITVPSSSGGAKKGGQTAEEGGIVEDINYVTTQIRREDNSLVAVPNHVFTHGEIINWSRTPFRLLKLQMTMATDELAVLPRAIASIREALSETEGVETEKRAVVVAATGFKDNKIIIDINCHLAAKSEEECADMKSRAVASIQKALEGARKAFKATQA